MLKKGNWTDESYKAMLKKTEEEKARKEKRLAKKQAYQKADEEAYFQYAFEKIKKAIGKGKSIATLKKRECLNMHELPFDRWDYEAKLRVIVSNDLNYSINFERDRAGVFVDLEKNSPRKGKFIKAPIPETHPVTLSNSSSEEG